MSRVGVVDINPFLAKIVAAYGHSVYGPRSGGSWAAFLGFTEATKSLVPMEEPVMLAGFYSRDFVDVWPSYNDITACCDQAVADLQRSATWYRKRHVAAIEFPQGTQLHVMAFAQRHESGGLCIHTSAIFKTLDDKRIDPTCFCAEER